MDTDLIISFAVPVISVALSFFFGQQSKSNDLSTETLKERYEKLYEPFIQLTIESWAYVKIASSFPDDLRDEFMQLFKNNIGKMGEEALSFYPEFYEHYLLFVQMIKGGAQHENAMSNFNVSFMKFGDILLKECSIIRKKLKYPPLSKRFSDAYSSRNFEQKQRKGKPTNTI